MSSVSRLLLLPANQSFTLNNVSMLMDTVICTPKYTEAVRSVMQTGEGLRLPFTSLQTGTHQVAASRHSTCASANSNSNSMSLFLLYDDKVAKEQETEQVESEQTVICAATFSSLRVRCGTKMFTPPDDIRSFTELTHRLRSASTLCAILPDLAGSTIRCTQVTMSRTQLLSGGKYGLCLLGCESGEDDRDG